MAIDKVQKVKIPINADIYQNVDEDAINIASPYLMNGYLDEVGNNNKRPGLLLFADIGTGQKIDGLYWFDKAEKVIVVSAGKIFSVTDIGNYTDLTGATGDTLISGVRPTFTDDGAYIIAANGGRMVYTNGTAAPTYIGDVDAPTQVTHVAYLDKYIICNTKNTGDFSFSDVGASISWNALSFAEAESLPDKIQSLVVNWRELTLIGSKTIDVYYNDGTTPFSRFEGAYSERGSVAPYSLVVANNTIYFLDHERKLIRLENRLPKMISFPFARVFQQLTKADDAIADVIEAGGKSWIILTFPTDGRTFAYEYITDKWAEWSYWNVAQAQDEAWLGNCSCVVGKWGKTLVGSRSDGKIFYADPNTYTDNGDIIRFVRRTGWIDHGTLSRKCSNKLLIKLKRGFQITGDAMPYLIVRWRDDGNKVWGNEVWIELQKIGVNEFVAELSRLGIYRSRQWEFIHTDATPLVICEAEEEIEVLM